MSQMTHPDYIVVGRLRRPHGLNGEILMDVMTDFPDRLQPKKTVYVGKEYQSLRIASIRWHQQSILISFDDYHDCDQVGALRNQMMYVRTDSLPVLPSDEYYHHQLIGMKVIDNRSGSEIGTLKEILQTGANDVYVIGLEENKELLLPAIEDVIISVDIEQKMMSVVPPEWR